MKDLAGHKFGRLTVIKFSHNDANYHHYWKCLCSCGAETVTRGSRLMAGACKSCGCLRPEITKARMIKHGGYSIDKSSEYRHGNPTYIIWISMHARCKKPTTTGYKNYGGRGIKVCERWGNFDNFLADMGERPSFKHSIGRIDNNGNYEPSNCRWETQEQQCNNTRFNRIETFNGVTDTITRLARLNGFNPMRIITRLHSGWTVEEALSTPIKHKQLTA